MDVAVIEVGLGGSNDATNVFDLDTLQLAVISAVGLEHQKALGEGFDSRSVHIQLFKHSMSF